MKNTSQDPHAILRSTATGVTLILGLAFSGCVFAQPFEYVDDFGMAPEIWNPTEVEIDSYNRILLTDTGNSRIQVCDFNGDCTAFGQYGQEPGEFYAPNGITLDNQGRILVADTQNHRIQRCSYEGQCEILFGSQGSGLGEFDYPTGIEVDSQDRILIADYSNNRIQVCDEQGSCTAFGTFGHGENQFSGPYGIALDSQERIIIGDSANHRMQVCDFEGNCTFYGVYGHSPGEFYLPQSVAVDSRDRIIVIERSGNRFQVCQDLADPETCTMFGARGQAPGQFEAPRGIGVDSSNRIVVADSGNHRIQIFRNMNFNVNAGLNDAWLKKTTGGQGFFVNVFPKLGLIFASWFTFDVERPDESVTAVLGEPGHRWLTALGPIVGTQAVLDIELVHGGEFDSEQPEPQWEQGYGTLTFDFHGCNAGTVTYDIPSLGLQGVVDIERSVVENVLLCQQQDGELAAQD